MEKQYTYGYQPLDDYSNQDTDETGVHKNIADAYELDDFNKVKAEAAIDDENNNHLSVHGIGVFTAGIFIVGEICGAGVVAFPGAMSKTGWGGLPLMFLVLVMSVYCGVLLGYSWKRVQKQRTEVEPIRDPYPYIGEVSTGIKMRHAVTFCLNLQIFFTCVVYLLLSAEIVETFVSFHVGSLHADASLRIWLAIIAIVILPFTWLGTPKDFWFVAIGAAASTAIAVIIIIIKYGLIYQRTVGSVVKAPVTLRTFSSAFGAIVFGFTGASLFPTIQSDMKEPDRFPKSAFVGYFGIGLLYLPTAIGGYITIGAGLQDSILKTLTHYDITHNVNHKIVAVIELLFVSHFLCGFVLMINPLLQQFENFFNVPYEFSVKRVGFRSLVVISILVVCEIFPQFGPIVDLIGGSVNVFICFIFPIVFYLKLYPETTLAPKLIMAIITVIAILGALAATVFNVINLKDSFYQLYLANNATGNPY